ncbi:hypothetical protein Pla123a_04290 [Posidoniimonas polymericola]|uniref:Uncharacterized protein n=1 Tax=Posidoniimonas polymericola TaxID=2528002 RepID=A0A5C5ZE76_9BACT|nr:hypothetical protein [Posidoniimonas polymericola]TWT85622.1 hypothetical protein Pla123a_04290 [Posidoniimonas polymericola]
MNENPYASPTAEEQPDVLPSKDIKDDRLLVTPPMCSLPPRCVYCNAAAGDSRPTAGYWWFSWSGLRRAKVQWFTCQAHKRQLNRQAWPGLAIGIAYPAIFLASALHDYILGEEDWLERVPKVFMPVFILTMVIASLLSLWLTKGYLKLPKVVRVKNGSAYLKHAGRPFLDSLTDGAEGFRVVHKLPS